VIINIITVVGIVAGIAIAAFVACIPSFVLMSTLAKVLQ